MRINSLAIVLLTFLCFSGKVYGEDSTMRPFRVGAILPLTGGTADYGESVRNSIELARQDRNDLLSRTVFYYEDAAYDPKQAVSAFQKLVRIDKVDLVYVWGVAFCKVVAPLAEASKIPLVGQCIDPEIGRDRDYVIRFMNYTDQYLRITSKYLAGKGHQRLGIVLTENPYLKEMYVALERNLLPGQSVKIIQRVQPTETDFRAIISKLRNSDIHAVGVFLSIGQISAFYRQMREQKMPIPTFGTNFFESLSEVNAAAGAMDGAVFANNDVREAFVKRYGVKYGKISQIGFGALAYEFALTLGRALTDLKNPTGKVVLENFEALPQQDGVAAGPYKFRFEHSVGRFFEFPIVMKEVQDDKFVAVQ